MFGLVAAVVSIALVAILSLASLLYTGSAFSSASLRAQVDQFTNGSMQVVAAATLYGTDTGKDVSDGQPGEAVDSLVAGGYLSSVPQRPQMSAAGAKWRLTSVRGQPVVSITLDDANPATALMCAEAAKNGGGCVDDVTTLSTAD